MSATHFTLNTGARIPAVGLGTWEAEGTSCTSAVKTALEVGYRHIDCAHLYGNEVEVGHALADALNGGIPGLQREDLFVTSKFWYTINAPKHVESSVEVSLKNLGLSYLDLYLVHWPTIFSVGDATDPPRKAGAEVRELARRIKGVWQTMEHLVEQGKVKAIGVSNFSIQQLEEILSFAKIVPAVNQVELHPFWRQDELVKFCQSKGIHVSAHTPLGVPGRSSGTIGEEAAEQSHSQAPAFIRSQSVHLPMLKSFVVSDIAERLGKTPAQVVLRWGIQRGTSVLPRSLKPDHIRSNFNLFDWSLTDEDWNLINTIEPQLRLIDSSYSFSSENGPLQAVIETDDDNEPDNI